MLINSNIFGTRLVMRDITEDDQPAIHAYYTVQKKIDFPRYKMK